MSVEGMRGVGVGRMWTSRGMNSWSIRGIVRGGGRVEDGKRGDIGESEVCEVEIEIVR